MNGVRCLAAFVFAVSGVCAGGAELEQARKLYNLTEFEKSLQVLRSIPDRDGSVSELMGMNYFMQGEYKKAAECFEKAVAHDPANSDYALWLGRAFGRRAETSSVFTAPGYASKTRQYFEKAVQLNPRNQEALSDLFEYYLEAPGILGGGVDKAQALAANIARVDAAEGHWCQARLADKRKDFAGVEDHLRRAVEASPQQIGRLIDLARFLAKQGRFQESDQSFERAEKIAPNSPRLLFARADVYIKNGRNLGTAKELLQRYLSSSLTPDDPPRSQAERLLRQVRGS